MCRGNEQAAKNLSCNMSDRTGLNGKIRAVAAPKKHRNKVETIIHVVQTTLPEAVLFDVLMSQAEQSSCCQGRGYKRRCEQLQSLISGHGGVSSGMANDIAAVTVKVQQRQLYDS